VRCAALAELSSSQVASHIRLVFEVAGDRKEGEAHISVELDMALINELRLDITIEHVRCALPLRWCDVCICEVYPGTHLRSAYCPSQ
jgi:hypothetical protein